MLCKNRAFWGPAPGARDCIRLGMSCILAAKARFAKWRQEPRKMPVRRLLQSGDERNTACTIGCDTLPSLHPLPDFSCLGRTDRQNQRVPFCSLSKLLSVYRGYGPDCIRPITNRMACAGSLDSLCQSGILTDSDLHARLSYP